MEFVRSALCLVALACLVLSPRAQEPSGPTQAEVEATCRLLDAALGPEGDPAGAREALKAALGVAHADVVARIAELGLRHAQPQIRESAVDALGRIEHPDALAALQAFLKSEKKALEESPPRLAALLKAIARHGQESSIPLLVQDAFQSPDHGVVAARILGLGRIRSRKSVDELVQLMRSAPRPRVADHMQEFRIALVVLTGEDKGTDQVLWLNWYGDHKSKLEIAPEPPAVLPPEIERRWNGFWGPERGQKKRGREK
jgi:HEAT repeat protein/PBS lyase HEAT-like repeat-containing protein